MHILIIPSEEYIPKHNPIAGIFQHDQAKILQQNGHQIGALSFTFKYSFATLFNSLLGKKNNQTKSLGFFKLLSLLISKTFLPYYNSIHYYENDKITILRCNGFWGLKDSKLPLSKNEIWLKYGEFALKKYIKRFGKPDLIHAHNMIYAGLLASVLHKKYKIPFVLTEHSSQYVMGDISDELFSIVHDVLLKEKNIYAVSPQLIHQLENKFNFKKNEQIKWLPNVLDKQIEDTPLITDKITEKRTVRYLNIANLIPLKGQKDLILAFNQVAKSVHNVELYIGGSGVLESELVMLIEELNLKEKVKLLGQLSRIEVINQINQSDIFVLPSHYETFGVVLIEALSRGVPVISTYCGGPECIVNETNGILVQPKDTQQLTDALLKMYYNHQHYNKEKLRKDIIDLYGKKAFYNRIIEIYKNILN